MVVSLALALALCLAPSASAKSPARLDPSLAGRGFLFTAIDRVSPIPPSSRVAQDSSGRLVAVTSAADELMVTRYLRNGQLDASFGTGGRAYVSLSRVASRREDDEAIAGAVAVQPDGRILVGGSYDPNILIQGGSGSSELALARLRPDGSTDRTFGGNARLEMPPGGVIEHRGTNVLAIALRGGDILVGGEAESGPAYVARYRANGTLDRSFGRGTGMAHFTRKDARGAVTGLLSLPSGKVYASGYLGANFLLARLDPNGIPDRGFGRAGSVLTDAARRPGCGCSVGGGLARDRHGRLLVSGTLLARRPLGYFNPDGVTGARAIAVARYRPSGALDREFGRDGVARTRIGALAAGRGIALQRNGRIVVAGSAATSANAQTRFVAVRYLPNGRRDRQFFDDGIFTRTFGALASGAWDPLVDRSGRVVVAGGAAFGDDPANSAREVLLTRFLPGR